MPFDATQLWWPPFGRLYNQLSSCKLEPSAASAEALQASLKEYDRWLSSGVSGFKPPNEKSRKALESEASLTIGDKKMPVDPALRLPAMEVSRCLGLDEVQSYILLRRWAAGAAGAAGGSLPPTGLSGTQLAELGEAYCRERLCLLKATEGLLWLGEEIGSGPFPDVVESTLASLLEAGLEDASFQALKENLEGPSAGGSGRGAAAAAAALPAPGGFTSLFGVGGDGIGGGGGGVVAAVGAGAAAGVAPAGGLLGEEQLGAERCCLLNILTLIYYHPRKQCTPERFLSLARLFHTRLFAVPLPRQAGGGGEGETSPARLALKLASVLLLEMLDVDKALSAVAENTPLTEENYAFAAPATRQQVNAELSSWWPQAGSAHAPVLLAWASVLCLIGRSGSQQGGTDSGTHVGAEEYGGHAQRAHETGALSTLCTLSSHAGMAPNAAEMASNILLSVLSAVVCAFDLSPLTMPLSLTNQVVTILCNLYQDQPSLCDNFWAEDRITEEPLRHFLGDVRGLFPAFPAPLYRMLCALSATSDAAVAANAYLAALPALVCIHSGLDMGEAILQDAEDDSSVYTQQVLALPGSRALTLPEGVMGEVLTLPEGAYGLNEALLLAGTGAPVADSILLVRWKLPLAEGTGQWVLLCRAFEAVAALQQACTSVDAATNEPALRAALDELRAALRLLSAICSHDPPTALELLHVEVPAGEGGGGGAGGESGPDVLSLACHAATVLCQMAEPPAETIGDCFAICASLAHSIPGRVHCELMGVLQLVGGLLADAAAAQDVPVLSRLLAAECTAGRYPATLAVLQLLSSLLSSGMPGRELQVCVAWALRRVLSEHHRWRYVERADRWRLAGAALRLLRHALAAAPPAGLGTGLLADAVEVLLQYDVGVAACLLPALPPPAKTLERMSLDPRREAEVLAVEDCCLEWMRLLPALLPAPGHGGAVGGSGTALGAGAFFREPQAAGAPCAAAVLLSYLAYEFFGSSERTMVLRAVHSLASAAATAAPGLAFAALLPSEGGSLSPAVKSLLRSALEPQPAMSNPQLAIAIFALLTTAVQHHASLADALLFPCKLEKALKENRDANTPAATPQPGVIVKKEGGGKKGNAAAEAGSCLDAAWALLQETEKLRKERPEVLAALLRLLSTLWQSGAAAFRPLAILRQQPQTWKLITSLITAATAAPAGALAPSTDAVGASDGSTQPAASSLSEGWREKEAETWVVAAEASALQIVAAECFMAASSLSPAEALPRELKEVFKKEGAMLLALLSRYSAPLPTAHLLGHVQQAAAAAGLQLLGEALADDTVWPSLVAGPSVVSSLHSAASTLLSQFGGRESAAAALSEHAAEIVERNAGQVAITQVGEVVMGLAEVPSRLLEGREFGAGYAFDAQLCMRRLGSVLSQQSPAAQMLLGWLAAASVAASMEDARLTASAALKALLTGLHRYSARLSLGTPAAAMLPTPTQQQLQDGISTIAAAADDIISQSLGHVDGEDAAMAPTQPASSCSLDLQSVHIVGSAEGAYVLLVLLRQWSAAGAGDEVTRIEVTTRLLELVSRWLGSLSDVLVASGVDGSSSSSNTLQSISSITSSLLATALLAVSTLPALEDVPPKPDNAHTQALQAAAAQCMPALLAACQRHRQHLAEAAGLATALMERCVPSPVVLPVVRASLNLGGLLADLLRALIANGLKRQTGGPACAEFPALGAGQQPRQQQQQQQWWRGNEGGGGSSGEGDEIGAALLLALQIAQVPGGAQLLLEQGVVGHVLLLCKWLLAPDGGDLMGETVAEATAPSQPVDYSNAYLQDGSPNPAHQLWCSGLSLVGLLLAALPGYESVESAALELAVAGEGRLLLAVEPPASTKQQPITLSMLQETRYSLFFLTGLARLAGRWRALLPDSLPQLRQASASLLDFVAHPKESAHCQPVSLDEKAVARGASAAAAGSNGISFTEGWVAALAGDKQGAATSPAIHMAERLYSCAQCALSFQLATAPEVGEEEAALLGPEWATPQALSALQDQCLSLIQAVPRSQTSPALRALCRTVAAVLAGTMQLQQAMAAQVPHQRMLQLTKAVQVVQQMLKGG